MTADTDSPGDVFFVDCADARVELTRRFYREILSLYFRPDELMPEDDLVAALTEAGGATVGTMAISADGEMLGGFVSEWYATSRVLLLSYLAIPPERRGQGIGSRLAEVAAPALLSRFDPLLVLAEVEDPRWYHADHNFGDAWARLRLYQRMGAQALPLDYFQPALAAGQARVPHLLLLSFYVHADALVRPGHVDGGIVERFLREYFAGCEGDAVDAPLEALLGACGTVGGLALATPSDYVAAPVEPDV
jgi:GNAT superfamily N-acetyltransferase